MPTTRTHADDLPPSPRRGVCAVTLAGVLFALATLAAAAGPTSAPPADASAKPPPTTRDSRRHEEFVKIAKAGGVDVVFFGDSITDFWRRGGKSVWAKFFAPLNAANFGIASEGTREVLWRVRNGELEGIRPKLVVLLIGTNNISEKPEAIALGVKSIITEIQTRSPGARILLHGIFPRGEKPGGGRDRIAQVNRILASYAQPRDPGRVVYVDIGGQFLNADGTMNKELMPDTLHPSEKGYQMWAEAIIETVNRELQTGAKPSSTTQPTSAPSSKPARQ